MSRCTAMTRDRRPCKKQAGPDADKCSAHRTSPEHLEGPDFAPALDVAERRAMLVDDIRELTRAIEERGTWVTGARGQDILNPALAARRASIEAIRRLDATTPPEAPSDPLGDFMEEGRTT